MTNNHPARDCSCQVKNTTDPHKFGPVCNEHARYTIPSQRTRGAVEHVCWVHRTAYMHGRNLEFVNAAPVVEQAPSALPLASNG